jgi:hypothetical protein
MTLEACLGVAVGCKIIYYLKLIWGSHLVKAPHPNLLFQEPRQFLRQLTLHLLWTRVATSTQPTSNQLLSIETAEGSPLSVLPTR